METVPNNPPQFLLGRGRLDGTARCFGIELDEAFEYFEQGNL